MPTIMFCLKLNSFPISRLIEKPRKREQSDKADKSNIFCLSLLDVTLKVYVGTSQGMLSLTTHIFYIQLLMKVSNLSQQPTMYAIILLHKILYEYMIIWLYSNKCTLAYQWHCFEYFIAFALSCEYSNKGHYCDTTVYSVDEIFNFQLKKFKNKNKNWRKWTEIEKPSIFSLFPRYGHLKIPKGTNPTFK